jgi:hypothetical protein
VAASEQRVGLTDRVEGFHWHTTWPTDSAPIKTVVLAMVLGPSYAIFAVLLMALSALAMRVLRWRPVAPSEMAIAELDWPLCNWARYRSVFRLTTEAAHRTAAPPVDPAGRHAGRASLHIERPA